MPGPSRPSRPIGGARTAAACVVLTSLTVHAVAAAPHAAAAPPPDPVAYSPPVVAEVVDAFRAPASAYGAGNRGVDYATTPGTAVAAAAAGTVAFAGAVGGSLHVSVLHPDGVRTTYSFLQVVDVRRGDRVESGQVLGRAASRLHWGARAGDAYIDPTLLLGRGGPAPRARLVPESGDRSFRPEAEERRVLADLLGKVGRGVRSVASVPPAVVRWAAAGAADVVRDEGVRRAAGDRGLAAWLQVLGPMSAPATAVATAVADARSPKPCTPPGVPPPPPPRPPGHGTRPPAVLVGDFGSSSPDHPGDATTAVFGVDTGALGGSNQHANLPVSPAAGRKIALAVAGRPPTCRGRRDAVVDAVATTFLGRAERGLVIVAQAAGTPRRSPPRAGAAAGAVP